MAINIGYGYIFIPLPISLIWTRKGIYQYLALAIPGLFFASVSTDKSWIGSARNHLIYRKHSIGLNTPALF